VPEEDNEEKYGDLMAYLDGELGPEARKAFERRAAEDPELARQVEAFARLVEETDHLRFEEPDPKVWDAYWDEVRSRLGRRVGWVFLAGGGAALSALGLWSYYSRPHHPLAEWGVGLTLLGVLALFVTVLRERLRELKHDRYRRIKR
jgi:ferric-dicitrate binding protein FerR (iron transport regulator)